MSDQLSLNQFLGDSLGSATFLPSFICDGIRFCLSLFWRHVRVSLRLAFSVSDLDLFLVVYFGLCDNLFVWADGPTLLGCIIFALSLLLRSIFQRIALCFVPASISFLACLRIVSLYLGIYRIPQGTTCCARSRFLFGFQLLAQ